MIFSIVDIMVFPD